MVLRFVLCSLISWLCQLPDPSPLVIESPSPIVEPGLWGNGQLWAVITDKDDGYCPDYGMPSGNGAKPYLVSPVVAGVVNNNRGFRTGHTGTDLSAPKGTPVLAPAGGVIIWAGVSGWCGAGCQVVVISHGGGWHSLLFHLSAVYVECGQWVGVGEVVGTVGDTGAATFFHTHYEIRNGNYSYPPELH